MKMFRLSQCTGNRLEQTKEIPRQGRSLSRERDSASDNGISCPQGEPTTALHLEALRPDLLVVLLRSCVQGRCGFFKHVVVLKWFRCGFARSQSGSDVVLEWFCRGNRKPQRPRPEPQQNHNEPLQTTRKPLRNHKKTTTNHSRTTRKPLRNQKKHYEPLQNHNKTTTGQIPKRAGVTD